MQQTIALNSWTDFTSNVGFPERRCSPVFDLRPRDAITTCSEPAEIPSGNLTLPLAFLYSTINGVARLIVDTRVEQGKIRTELADRRVDQEHPFDIPRLKLRDVKWVFLIDATIGQF